MVFGRSGGVQGHGMDHANRFSRSLAGFGLTWPDFLMARFSHGRFFSWPILLMADSSFFVPETLDPFFLNIEKDAHRKMIEIRQIKS